MSVWWYECEHCHARFMQASSLDEHVCAQKRIAELEECITALESALAEAQRERDEDKKAAAVLVATCNSLHQRLREARDERDEARVERDDALEELRDIANALERHAPVTDCLVVAVHTLIDETAQAKTERDEAREELDRLRRALDLALTFDWMRGTGKAREGTDG